MTPSTLRTAVVTERLAWTERMLTLLRALPLATAETFRADPRTAAAAESYLRRALEALLDLARHVLARGFGHGVAEYKQVADALRELGVLDTAEAMLLRELAGYRNRIVHFYHEIRDDELYQICTAQLGDIETVRDALLRWLRAHPELLDGRL